MLLIHQIYIYPIFTLFLTISTLFLLTNINNHHKLLFCYLSTYSHYMFNTIYHPYLSYYFYYSSFYLIIYYFMTNFLFIIYFYHSLHTLTSIYLENSAIYSYYNSSYYVNFM